MISGANAAVTADAVPESRILLAQLEVPLDQVVAAFRQARERNARTILNPAPASALPDELVAMCDILVPNEHELSLLGDPQELLDRGVGAVVATLGASGVAVSESVDGRIDTWTEPAIAVTSVDTTGAGDAFCGALAARLACGDDLHAAVHYAVAAGGLATTVAGAVPSLPHSERVLALSRPSPP